jgi:hypothetical protein
MTLLPHYSFMCDHVYIEIQSTFVYIVLVGALVLLAKVY